MAATKASNGRKASLDTVLTTMERGFAAVASDIADFKSTMATKAEVAAIRREMVTKEDLREELRPIRSELKSIRNDLGDLTEKVEVHHALARIATIEKHLGLDKKIVA